MTREVNFSEMVNGELAIDNGVVVELRESGLDPDSSYLAFVRDVEEGDEDLPAIVF